MQLDCRWDSLVLAVHRCRIQIGWRCPNLTTITGYIMLEPESNNCGLFSIGWGREFSSIGWVRTYLTSREILASPDHSCLDCRLSYSVESLYRKSRLILTSEDYSRLGRILRMSVDKCWDILGIKSRLVLTHFMISLLLLRFLPVCLLPVPGKSWDFLTEYDKVKSPNSDSPDF